MFQIRPLCMRQIDFKIISRGLKRKCNEIQPVFDVKYLTDPANLNDIKFNISNRKGVGNIEQVHELLNQLNQLNDHTLRDNIQKQLEIALKSIPNKTHPTVMNYGNKPMEVNSIGTKREFSFAPLTFDVICKKLNMLRMEHLGNVNGSRSYYLMSELAELEQALIRYTVNKLRNHQFELISVPEILPANVIEGCGMSTTGEYSQVYKTLPDKLCLSGTSEMALAGFFAGKTLNRKSLPIKVMAASRCFRSEVSSTHQEKGIFRVHSFTKVEMFSVCSPNQSEQMLEEFKSIEVDLFEKLGLHFVVLDMPPCELGAPAYRKYDIEAWMPGRAMYGEISSCSNCTDYQSRRLDIRCNDENGDSIHAHTVNGTACAIPRMLIAILETYQNQEKSIDIPVELQRFMNGKTKILPTKSLPALKLVKSIPNAIV